MSKLRQRIISAYDSLTKRERQLSDLLMENPELALIHSASDLARMAGVSNSTVTRFTKNIGLETFDTMRREIRDEYGKGAPLTLLRPPETPPQADMVADFARQEVSVLESTFANLDRDVLDRAAQTTIDATQLGFLGMRNSHFFAAYAHWQFVQFRPGTRLLSGSGETSAEHLGGFKKGDAVLIVGVRRLVDTFSTYLEILADAGVDIILVIDSSSLHLAQYAKWTIICPIENDHIFDSYSGVLAVLRLLSYTAFQKSGESGLNHMALIEKYHTRLHEL